MRARSSASGRLQSVWRIAAHSVSSNWNPARVISPSGSWRTASRNAGSATLQGMKKYLGSGLVKGIGPVMAGRIVDTFGAATFEVIDTDPRRLTEIPGIGPVRAGRIAATW